MTTEDFIRLNKEDFDSSLLNEFLEKLKNECKETVGIFVNTKLDDKLTKFLKEKKYKYQYIGSITEWGNNHIQMEVSEYAYWVVL